MITLSLAILGGPAIAAAQTGTAQGAANGTAANSAPPAATDRTPGTAGGAENPKSFFAGGTKTTTGQPAIGTETDGTPQPVPGAVVRKPPSGHGY